MDILKDKFNIISITSFNGNRTKIMIDKSDLKKCISFLKNSGEFSADVLISITAVDLISDIELIYNLYSTKLNLHKYIAVKLNAGNPVADSIASIFKSAAFDEREIFDLFGVEFEGHNNLKRLLLPNSMLGNPLLKNYIQNDERLAWND